MENNCCGVLWLPLNYKKEKADCVKVSFFTHLHQQYVVYYPYSIHTLYQDF